MGAAAVQAGRREGASCGGSLARGGTRGAHVKHGVHVRDAGRVEAQRLVERQCILPSRKGSIGRGARGGPGGGRACVGGGGGASSVQAQDPTAEAAGGGTRDERT